MSHAIANSCHAKGGCVGESIERRSAEAIVPAAATTPTHTHTHTHTIIYPPNLSFL